jgi:hypothetical protein
MDCELWRTIGLFPDYQVSNYGRVRRAVAGRSWNAKVGRILKLQDTKDGYRYLWLHNHVDGGCRRADIHRIVAQAFIPNPKNLPEVNHKIPGYAARSNNRVDNLEWVTTQGNANHAITHGRRKLGSVRYRPHRNKWEVWFRNVYQGIYRTHTEAVEVKNALLSTTNLHLS